MRFHRWLLCGLLLVASWASACAPSGVGAPCVPEAIGAEGFNEREVTIETGSVQCRTRICMVFHLEGDPRRIVGTASCPSGASRCVVDDPSGTSIGLPNSLDRVFCTARCVEGGSECGEGFRCVADGQLGGGVCVPSRLSPDA